MHELGLCDALLKMVVRIAEEDGEVSEIESVTVEIGELSGVVPRFMEECWTAVVDQTPYEHTKLVIEMKKGKLICESCGKLFPGTVETRRCPFCESPKLTPAEGRGMLLKEILCR